MKNVFFLITIMMLSFSSQAQTEFAPIGAKWYYNCEWGTIYIPGGEVIQSHFNHVISKKDTTIDGNNCRILRQYYDSSDTIKEEYVIKIVKGKVYYYYLGHFNLLFDFDAQINDTVLFTFMYKKYDYDAHSHKDTILSARYVVENVDTYSQNFRKFTTKIIEEDMVVNNGIDVLFKAYQYFEKIGFYDTFIPVLDNIPHPDDDNRKWLRCYSDSEFSYIAEWWKHYSLPCDYYYSNGMSINSQKVEENIKIYPNPFNDNIFVFSYDGGNIEIIDVLGKVVYSSELSNGINEISTNHFLKGIFLVKIQKNNNCSQIYKIVK